MSIEKYMADIPPHRFSRFNAIFTLITQHYPTANISLKYKMPTFELNNRWIAIANQKSYISVYTCVAEHIAEFQALHPKVKTGKGCINIKDSDDFPVEDLLSIISKALTSQ